MPNARQTESKKSRAAISLVVIGLPWQTAAFCQCRAERIEPEKSPSSKILERAKEVARLEDAPPDFAVCNKQPLLVRLFPGTCSDLPAKALLGFRSCLPILLY